MLIHLKNKKIIIPLSIFAAVLALVIAAEIFTPGVMWIFTPSAKARDGVLPVEGIEHISEVPQGEIRYLINDNIVFESDSKKGTIMFENPADSEYAIKFYIYQIIGDGETENLIYESPTVEPGQYIMNDKLKKKLKKGSYDCVCYARAYIGGELKGERSGNVTVRVLS